MYLEPPADGPRGPLVPEERLQPEGARSSAQPTAARRGTTVFPGRSAQGRTVKFTVNDSTSVTELEESQEVQVRPAGTVASSHSSKVGPASFAFGPGRAAPFA